MSHLVVILQTQKLFKGFCHTWLGQVCMCTILKVDIIVYYLSHLSTRPPTPVPHSLPYLSPSIHLSYLTPLHHCTRPVASLPPCNQAHLPLPIAFWVFLSSHHPGPLVSSSRLLTCLPAGEPQQQFNYYLLRRVPFSVERLQETGSLDSGHVLVAALTAACLRRSVWLNGELRLVFLI